MHCGRPDHVQIVSSTQSHCRFSVAELRHNQGFLHAHISVSEVYYVLPRSQHGQLRPYKAGSLQIQDKILAIVTVTRML